MIRVGMSTAAFYGWRETDDHALRLSRMALDVCEVFLETHSEYSSEFGALVRRNLGDLPCASVHAKGTQFESDLFGQSARQVQDALNIFTGVCNAGQALGAKWYVMHGPGTINTPRRPHQIRGLTDRIPQMQAIAAARGIEVLWENVSWCSMRSPEDVHSVRELLPGMGFVLDVKQAYRAGSTPEAILAAMGPQIRHVHALDMDADGRLVLPGQGMTDWRALVAQLRDQGFDGAVILEPYAGMAADDGALQQSVDFLRNVFA